MYTKKRSRSVVFCTCSFQESDAPGFKEPRFGYIQCTRDNHCLLLHKTMKKMLGLVCVLHIVGFVAGICKLDLISSLLIILKLCQCDIWCKS